MAAFFVGVRPLLERYLKVTQEAIFWHLVPMDACVDLGRACELEDVLAAGRESLKRAFLEAMAELGRQAGG